MNNFSRKGAKTQSEFWSPCLSFASLRFCGKIFLLLLVVAPIVCPQTPDLTNLEQSVREQITAAQAALAALSKTPSTTETALSEAYGRLGEIYHAYSLTSAARDSYLNANRLALKEFRWIYLLARLDQQDGRFDDAIRRYRLALTLQPDYVAALVNLGNIFLELNRLDEAAESFKSALKLEQNNPAAHYGLGQVAISKRSYAEAVDHFEKTLAQVPEANRVHYSLAMAYRGLGDVNKVKAHLAQQGTVGVRVSDPLVDRLQDSIAGERLHLSRGKVAFEAQRYAEAANEFRKAVDANPESVAARVNLGAALTQLGDLNGAGEQFEAALRIEPGKINAHYNLAVLLARQNKHAQAITHLRSALSVEPGDQSARFLLAQELNKSGRVDEALSEYARVDPGNEGALLEQVRLLYRKGQFKQALDRLEKGHAQYPQRGRTVVMLAYLLAASPQLELRNGVRALELAQRVYNATSAAQHGALIALALAEAGRCSEASEWQRRMIAAAEGDADLLAKLKAGLKLYENVQSCRPTNETSLVDVLLFEKN
jgi:tetratricopeptide (TPR) repeat protein